MENIKILKKMIEDTDLDTAGNIINLMNNLVYDTLDAKEKLAANLLEEKKHKKSIEIINEIVKLEELEKELIEADSIWTVKYSNNSNKQEKTEEKIIEKIENLTDKKQLELMEEALNVNGEVIKERKEPVEENKSSENVNNNTFTLLEDFEEMPKIKGFKLEGGPFRISTNWTDLLRNVCQQLFKIDEEKFRQLEKASSLQTSGGRSFVSKTKEKMSKAFKISEDMYIETQFGKEKLKDLLIEILIQFEIDLKDLEIRKK